MNIVGSPDIQNLVVKATWDISSTTPQILLENLSAGPDLGALSWWFVAKSPTQTFIHEGIESSPDITGVWTSHTLSDPWPRPFNQIEWSGAEYTFQAFVKDSDGNVFSGDVLSAAICRPTGNLQTAKNTYGLASVIVQVKCDQARIYFQDTTNTSYKGITGTISSSLLKVNFPMDETGTVPAPFSLNNFSSALVPITYSGKGYQFYTASVYNYELAENTFVRIKYVISDTFGVWCNVDLMPLVCEFEKLSQSLANGSCVNVEEAQNKLTLITPKFFELLIGVSQPLTGVDVPALIEEIKTIGGFDCNCCDAATGIVPPGSSAFDGYNFQIISQGGDIGGSVVPNGFNIQFLLHDVRYIVKVCDGSPADTTAFAFVPSLSGDGYTKTYCMTVDIVQFGYDLGVAIGNNPSLLNFWQQLFSSSDGEFNLIVDGNCIFSSSTTCDYTLTLSTIPVNTTYATLTGIKIGTATTPLTYFFNLTSIAGLQTYLNSLGLGTFVVTNPSGQTVLITSTANPNDIQQLYYKVSSTVNQAALSKNCTGFIPISANQVVQNIINYICDLDDSKIKTSADYEVCYIDSDGAKQTVTVDAGQSLTSFLQELNDRGCQTIDYIVSLSSINCAAIKAKFPSSAEVMGADDIFLVTKAGNCSSALPTEAFLYMLTYGQYSAEVLAAFCNLMTLCGGGQPCAPYDAFYASLTDFDEDCPVISGFTYTWDGTTLVIGNVIFSNTPASSQNITVEYKLAADSAYTVYSGSSPVGTDGTPTTPIEIALSAGQSYNVRLANNCESPLEYFTDNITAPGSVGLVTITNLSPAVTISSISGLTGFTLASPIVGSGQRFGTHDAFTGSISAAVSGSPISGSLRLLRNSIQLECINVGSSGAYGFGSQTYAVTDTIEVRWYPGPC